MLAQEVVAKYGDRARFKVEDFGQSALAKRFGVDKYPAIFVDDALVARPEDFYAWGGPETGRYVPWRELTNRRKFQADLQRMIDVRLAGGRPKSAAVPQSTSPKLLPTTSMSDMAGQPFSFASLRGKPVVIEFWATWCPICLDTLTWMKTAVPDSVAVVAVAVDSDAKDIEKVVQKIRPQAKVVVASPELRQAFSGPPAVPTLLIADGEGRIVRTFYGAPPGLHDEIAKELAKLRKRR